MGALSQIVGVSASPFGNSLCVAPELPEWQIVSVPDATDKNGGPNFLRAWRAKRGLSQEQLAKAVDTSPNMIQYLETGERGLSAKWLRRLAPALDTTPGMLLDTDPDEVDIEIHDFWTAKLDKDQRRQVKAIAEALLKTGTSGE